MADSVAQFFAALGEGLFGQFEDFLSFWGWCGENFYVDDGGIYFWGRIKVRCGDDGDGVGFAKEGYLEREDCHFWVELAEFFGNFFLDQEG